MGDRGFGSDNHAGVHPDILSSLSLINQNHSPSYGTDDLTKEVQNYFKNEFHPDADSFFVFNGTAANVLCLKAMVQSYHAVICTDISHLNVDECAAPETHVGCKLIAVNSLDGKLTAQQIEDECIRQGDQHYAQVKAVSITQPTEVGTMYSFEELQAISKTCKKHNLLLHIDGARFIYTPIHLQRTFKEFFSLIHVDTISFGGTKNGLLFGEVVIILNKELQKDFKFIRKQSMQLPSKMRFLAQQFKTLLFNGLWKEIAEHGIEMAQYLKSQLEPIPQIKIYHTVQANSVFVQIPKEWTKKLKKHSFFYVWDHKNWVMRWMISFDTQKNDIDSFIETIKELSKNE